MNKKACIYCEMEISFIILRKNYKKKKLTYQVVMEVVSVVIARAWDTLLLVSGNRMVEVVAVEVSSS